MNDFYVEKFSQRFGKFMNLSCMEKNSVTSESYTAVFEFSFLIKYASPLFVLYPPDDSLVS